MQNRCLLLTAGILYGLLACGTLAGQQDMGVITGVVTDQSGAVVAGARLEVKDTETNETRIAETLDTGAYSVGPLRLPPP